MALTGKFVSSYKKVNEVTGQLRTMFVYEVSGKKSEVDQYAADQEANGHLVLDEKTGKPLFFQTQHSGNVVAIIKTRKTEKYIVDSSHTSALLSRVDSLGTGLVAQAAAQMVAANLFGDLNPKAAVDSAPEKAQVAGNAGPLDIDEEEEEENGNEEAVVKIKTAKTK